MLKGSRLRLTNNQIKYIINVIINSQEVGFLNFLRPLMTAGLPLMKNVQTPLAKRVLVPFGLTAAASTADAAIQKNIFGSGLTTYFQINKWFC